MLFPLWGQVVYPLWWPSLTKDMQTEQLLCWSGMTDTEQLVQPTSSSNEEECQYSNYDFSSHFLLRQSLSQTPSYRLWQII